MQTNPSAVDSLEALPWDSPFSSKSKVRRTKHSGQKNLWSSAPNLDFNPDWSEETDDFETTKKPDFSKSFQNLSFDVDFDDLDDDSEGKQTNPFRQPDSPTRVKVKSRKDKEITDLFTKWKIDQKNPTADSWQLQWAEKSPATEQKSVERSNKPKPSSVSKNIFPMERNLSNSPPCDSTKNSPTKKKKKIAVKLKASDLNLSLEKQREIEQMFRKLQQKPQNKGQSKISSTRSSEQRWSDEQKQHSMARPKPATRQRSLDRDEIDFERPRLSSPEKMKPIMPSNSDTMSCASAKIYERRGSGDRERSRSRNPENRRRKESKSRSPSRDNSNSRDRRSSRRSESKERTMRSRSSSRSPGSESKSTLRRQTSVESTDSCSSGRSRSRPRRASSRSQRTRSSSRET